METSQKRFVWFVVALFVVALIVVGLVFWYRSTSSSDAIAPRDSETVQNAPSETAEAPMRIIAKHQFKDGLHIVAGEVSVPTPCHSLDAQARALSPASSQISINFTTATQGDICAQVITQARFKVEFDGPENAQISATWNGKPAVLNLIPVAAGEDLVDFDIFIKG